MTQLSDLLWGEIKKATSDIPVREDRCKAFLTQSLKGGASIQSAASSLAKAINGDKGNLVDQDALHRKLVGLIWEQMRTAMPGISLIEIACKAKLTEELKSGKSPDKAVASLVKDMKANPRWYTILPSPPSYSSCYDSCRHCRGCCP